MSASLVISLVLLGVLTPSGEDDACVEVGRGFVKCNNVLHIPCGIPNNTTQLDMSGNSLTAIPGDFFENLTMLQQINLSGNLLTSIPRDLFRGLISLRVIILMDNKINRGFYLPEGVTYIELSGNRLSLTGLRIILTGKTEALYVGIANNPLGPELTADIFAGFYKTRTLVMSFCNLEHIEGGAFQAMTNLKHLDLNSNLLSRLDGSTLVGPGHNLKNLLLHGNKISSVTKETFSSFTGLLRLNLAANRLDMVPDLPRNGDIMLKLSLAFNMIKQLALETFQNVSVVKCLDLSFNHLEEIPDGAFSSLTKLSRLLLNHNNIRRITDGTFTGMEKVEILFLHNNKIKFLDHRPFRGTKGGLLSLTLFDNPITSLPSDIFQDLSPDTEMAITCANLHHLPAPINSSVMISCLPFTSLNLVVTGKAWDWSMDSLIATGFSCDPCTSEEYSKGCWNCTFCQIGTRSNGGGACVACPAGGFYQDAVGQTTCKNCSYGTYVSEDQKPGKSADDCWACPYGTLTNETAGYRACRCLPNFFRTDRFGPCSPCPKIGVVCANDTAILAPDYYWSWTSEAQKNNFKKFVENILNRGPDYDKTHSKFEGSIPLPHKCPRVESCEGGIDSQCRVGYKGLLCASCTEDHYSRMNTCLKCPSKARAILSFVGVVLIVVVVFIAVFLGDSIKAANHRTLADVIMSCFKIIIGFYQVMSGIFSALVRIRWPVTVATIATWLKFVEGNILQFAPLSCIHPSLRFDPFVNFAIAVSVNVLAIVFVLGYLLLKSLYIENQKDLTDNEKRSAISNLKKSCYRNIFLFLLTLYPSTATKIAHIIPNACVKMCFAKDKARCDSFLRADLSIRCFTSRHNMFWHFAVVSALYPVGFPLLLLVLLYNFYRKPVCRRLASLECKTDDQEELKNLRDLVPQEKREIAFGLSVFFENYRFGCWYWEILEMYRKLLLTSGILIFTPESRSRIGFSVITASIFGIVYTSFRPIKSKFEDLLQTVSLWVVFFDVCFAAIFADADILSNSDLKRENDSVFANILFVVLNCLVLIIALVEGGLYVKSSWRKLSGCIKQLFLLQWEGIWHLRRRRGYQRLP